jgi:uncharacterized protein (DUF2249 family)
MSSNEAVISAIRAHHRQLSDELRTRTDAVLGAAQEDALAAARGELHAWYRAELLPHAAAEEKTLYAAGADLDATRLLVRGMVAEHEALVGLVDRLATAGRALEVATLAASARTLFAVHLVKENDLLLPALDGAGVALEPLLAGMHELIGGAAGSAHSGEESGCGCGGCGCDESGQAAGDVPLAAPVSAGELDVRALPHGARHDIIFTKLDALTPGESLTIVNDHDPKPLRYQTSAIWPDRFAWNYRDAGPQLWRVEITDAR